MADDDNVVLRLLREIRDEQRTQGRDLTTLKREVGEIKESLATSLGLAAHANVVVGRSGERFDELTDEIVALKRRVAELEAKR